VKSSSGLWSSCQFGNARNRPTTWSAVGRCVGSCAQQVSTRFHASSLKPRVLLKLPDGRVGLLPRITPRMTWTSYGFSKKGNSPENICNVVRPSHLAQAIEIPDLVANTCKRVNVTSLAVALITFGLDTEQFRSLPSHRSSGLPSRTVSCSYGFGVHCRRNAKVSKASSARL
jgi:hypothetical protein